MTKTSIFILGVSSGLLVVALRPAALLGQGDPAPTAPPGPTMKSLAEIYAKLEQMQAKLDSRTPISSVPFTINSSGSYYLTRNLNVASGDAITIGANDVTLDLNGFTISSTHPTGNGTAVLISGTRQNVAIKNGHIRGTTTYTESPSAFTPGGFLDGVANASLGSSNLRVSDLNVLATARHGIALGFMVPTFVVERCNVGYCVESGIFAGIVRDCAAAPMGGSAIGGDIVTNCSGHVVGAFGPGILGNSTVENCRGQSVGFAGVTGSSVSNSHGTSTSDMGLRAKSASNCSGHSESGFGLLAETALNCFGTTIAGPSGVTVNSTASSCRAIHFEGGTAINAPIAIGCTASIGTISSPQKHLGTP